MYFMGTQFVCCIFMGSVIYYLVFGEKREYSELGDLRIEKKCTNPSIPISQTYINIGSEKNAFDLLKKLCKK